MIKALEPSWRWYGPEDPVSLTDIRQAGATGIVTSLHHVPNGEAWTGADISARQSLIEAAGLRWTVVESVPVSEDIKRGVGDFRRHIENYKICLRRLAAHGIKTVCYNFMPVLDWSRTDLDAPMPDGSTALRFDRVRFAVFDLHLLKRAGAAADYTSAEIAAAAHLFATMGYDDHRQLRDNIVAGLPGANDQYTLASFRAILDTYVGIDANQLRKNLILFLREVVPVAEANGLYLTIHPDDPPFSILGLPRIVCNEQDIATIMNAVDSPHNGLCFCTGSYGARPDNDLPGMLSRWGDRIHFVHLRATKRDRQGNFHEANHLEGDVDMYEIMDALLRENARRQHPIPMRPDHGHRMLDDLRKRINPGYSAIGRLRGLAELRGVEYAILRAQGGSVPT